MDRGCVTCHSINGVGGFVGPDLTQVGAWTQLLPVEEWEAFLYEWVEFPPTKDNRMPVYWSNYSGPLPYAAVGAAARAAASGGRPAPMSVWGIACPSPAVRPDADAAHAHDRRGAGGLGAIFGAWGGEG